MKDQILQLLERKDYLPANVPELLRRLRLPPNRQQELQAALRQLEQSGAVARIKGNRYIQPREADLIPGRIRMNRQGKGFLQPDDADLKEIAIEESATGTALHEDRVLVRREVRPKGLGRRTTEPGTGEVVRILERRRKQFVGTLQRGRQFLFVTPDDPRIPHDILVPEPRDVGRPARIGDKVVVELREWESRHTNPEGEIIEVLGPPDAEGVDMLSVLRQYDLPLHFPKPVLHEAHGIGTTVHTRDLAGREDCRHHRVITIDPDDAKDFDDAICLERVSPDEWRSSASQLQFGAKSPPSPPDGGGRRGSGRGGTEFSGTPLSPALSPLVPRGARETAHVRTAQVHGEEVSYSDSPTRSFPHTFLAGRGRKQAKHRPQSDVPAWRLWVHIADVSHYVKPGTALDNEARKRGNSTYLVDRVIPMLPEALSNELCSLKPNVDRLTKCVEFLISHDGRVLNAKFYSAVIHSQRRFTYGEVLEILGRKPTSDPIEQMLHQANELTQRIRRLRFKAGSLDLDFPETKIRLDERGRILRIEKTVNDVSHQLIEECMLLANEAVAARLMSQGKPAVYRVHEVPDERRLQEYREDVLSQNIPCGNLSHPAEVQRLLHRLNALPIGPALKIGFLKSLMRARYAVEPLGHYGLAKKKYTHFTSPIRRYADLIVHRALFESHPLPRRGGEGRGEGEHAGSEHVSALPLTLPSPLPTRRAVAPSQREGRGKTTGATYAALKETAEHISVTERNSADAERDSKDLKLFAFLKAQLASGHPEHYPALVTDVRNFGFFVDVPGLAMSGLVPLSTVEDDFYVFDVARNHLVGRRTRRVIRLGDKVTVQVAKVDSFKKQVDFRLAIERKPAAAHHPPRRQTHSRRFTQRGR